MLRYVTGRGLMTRGVLLLNYIAFQSLCSSRAGPFRIIRLEELRLARTITTTMAAATTTTTMDLVQRAHSSMCSKRDSLG